MLRNGSQNQLTSLPPPVDAADLLVDHAHTQLPTEINPVHINTDSNQVVPGVLIPQDLIDALDALLPAHIPSTVNSAPDAIEAPDALEDVAGVHTDCSLSLLCIAPYIPAVFSALNDAASDAVSLYEGEYNSIPLLLSASTITFLASLELSGQSTTSNLKEIVSIMTAGRQPGNWPRLSKPKIIAVTTLASGFAIWCALSEGVQAFNFIESVGSDYKIAITPYALNYWRLLAATTAIGAGTTTLLTDNYETGKVMWHLMAGYITPHANRVSACIAPFVGSLCILGAFTSALQSHSSIRQIFNIQSTTAIASLGGACLINMTSTLCFSGGTVATQVDDLFAYLSQQKFEPAKIFALFTSLSLAIFLSYLKRPLNMGYYRELANSDIRLPTAETPDYLFESLAWMNFIYEVMFVTASLNPQMIHLFGHVFDKIIAVFSCLTKPRQPHPAAGVYPAAVDDVGDHDESYSPLLNDNERDIESGRPSQSGIFANRRQSTEELDIPRISRKSGCPCIII